MNKLSWFFYLADMASGMSFLIFSMGVACVALMFILPTKSVEMFSADHTPFQSATRPSLWIGLVLCSVLFCLIPSSETIYKIAASEIGETVVTSPEAKELYEDLKAIIKKQVDM
jgi:hypothetical protein